MIWVWGDGNRPVTLRTPPSHSTLSTDDLLENGGYCGGWSHQIIISALIITALLGDLVSHLGGLIDDLTRVIHIQGWFFGWKSVLVWLVDVSSMEITHLHSLYLNLLFSVSHLHRTLADKPRRFDFTPRLTCFFIHSGDWPVSGEITWTDLYYFTVFIFCLLTVFIVIAQLGVVSRRCRCCLSYE